ncbi:cell division protein FtsL [Clostridium sp. Ade.TY]|uniref:cell division protein FtsL n=1 Tax=Clostridium sp. Ade.TY TaxID=1391647 RepID=UPI000426A768|nr:cell division protein FtsL [Clostridium sp. Ade.TY]
MIVKDFDYVRGNTAVKPQRKYDDIKKDKQRKNQRNNKKKKLATLQKKKKIAGTIQVALVIFILGVATIWRDTKVYNLQTQVGTINSEIKTMNSENEALRVDLLKHSSLKGIESKAKNKLGMLPPAKADKVDIDLSKDCLNGLER